MITPAIQTSLRALKRYEAIGLGVCLFDFKTTANSLLQYFCQLPFLKREPAINHVTCHYRSLVSTNTTMYLGPCDDSSRQFISSDFYFLQHLGVPYLVSVTFFSRHVKNLQTFKNCRLVQDQSEIRPWLLHTLQLSTADKFSTILSRQEQSFSSHFCSTGPYLFFTVYQGRIVHRTDSLDIKVKCSGVQ